MVGARLGTIEADDDRHEDDLETLLEACKSRKCKRRLKVRYADDEGEIE